MNEANVGRACLFCEKAPAFTWYGLCEKCSQNKARRRLYLCGRSPSPEWEAHLLYLTDRAKRKLPLFEAGYESPPGHLPCRRKRDMERLPIVRHLALPPNEFDAEA